MAAVSPAELRRLSIDISSYEDSPVPSPRHTSNKIYSHWGVREVVYDPSLNSQMLVTVHFPDERRQKIPLNQFIQLANYGIDSLAYDLTNRTIDFVFKEANQGIEFSKQLESYIKEPHPVDPGSPPPSPAEQHLFEEWEMTEAEPLDLQLPSVSVSFADDFSRDHALNQLPLVKESGVSKMIISLESPKIEFQFLLQEQRNSFLERLTKSALEIIGNR